MQFESFVNSEECKTHHSLITLSGLFVNSEECKTLCKKKYPKARLRALLIQKSVKLARTEEDCGKRLRALLIQKSVKRCL